MSSVRSASRPPARLVRALLVSVAGLAAVLALCGTSGSDPAGARATTAAAPDCLRADARVRTGADGRDPNSLSRAQAASIQRSLDARTRSLGLDRTSHGGFPGVTVDTYVHVITKADGTGRVSRSRVRQQIAVLNEAFSGRAAEADAPTIFRFRLKALDYTADDDWYDWADDDDAPAKAALHRGDLTDLNLYVTGLGGGLLGYATFPFEVSNLSSDGVVLLNDSLPGGSAAPYNLGDTAPHEVGHWLGLFHTFQNGCSAPGDGVSDTPYQADGVNIFSCNESLDTCTQKGRDPVHNYMSYGDDPCLDRFSVGQSVRMALVWFAFRAGASGQPRP